MGAARRMTAPGGRPPRLRRIGIFFLVLLGLSTPLTPTTVRAVIQTDQGAPAIRQVSTGDLDSDELAAYNLQGKFGNFLGTPIAASHFITAQHVGISLSDTISFDQGPNAGTYAILSWVDDPASDLRIVEIDGEFSAWAPLWGSPNETGRLVTIFGRGGPPSGSTMVDSELKGWTTGYRDGQISWGRNIVEGTSGLELIRAGFDTIGLPTEGGLSSGDSGGGWFAVDAQGTMRLMAISFSVTGPFQLDAAGTPDGNSFNAVLFDIGGLWVGDPGAAVFVAENPVNIPGNAFATRISERIDWIGSVISLSSMDSDGDGVLDAFDNCPHLPNVDQLDSGGVGTGIPDGIGDACQCGDVTGDGEANSFDAEWIKRQALGLAAPLFLVPENCDVTGDMACDGMDALLVRHAAAGNTSPFFGQSCPNAVP